ncbi:unnamed protein product [Durusdinium trenchii]|uniref:16S rRNA (uracil(1498)-N(3))-methyltransferase n=1 Tax=Durusdinium trenchii TaxID=1381693 RepID=A0ABP0SQ56_9DINO
MMRRWCLPVLAALVLGTQLDFLLLEPEELEGRRRAVLPFTDPRVKAIQPLLWANDPCHLQCGIVGEGIGDAEVAVLQWKGLSFPPGRRGVRARPEPKSLEVLLKTSERRDPGLPKPRKHLLLAIPRPSRLERLLPHVAHMGVGHLILTGANKVDAKYFRSHVMEGSYLRRCLGLGLAGAKDTTMPQVTIQPSLQELLRGLEQILPGDVTRLVAHPVEEEEGPALRPSSSEVLMAIGPEAGWEESGSSTTCVLPQPGGQWGRRGPVVFSLWSELNALQSSGFRTVSLGPRTLRTDVAAVAALALSDQLVAPLRGERQ